MNPMKIPAIAICVLSIGCAAITERVSLPPVTETHDYLDERPMVVRGDGAKVYREHNSGSLVLTRLPAGAVVTALAEGGSEGRVAYYKIRSASGTEGWCKRWGLSPITREDAETAVLRDQQEFEQALQDSIFGATRRHIADSGIHPASRVEGIWITAGQDSVDSSAGHTVDVRALMKGAILGYNQYQVDLVVDLFIALNRDHLSASIVEVNRVTVVNDETIKELPIQKSIGLLRLLFGIL